MWSGGIEGGLQQPCCGVDLCFCISCESFVHYNSPTETDASQDVRSGRRDTVTARFQDAKIKRMATEMVSDEMFLAALRPRARKELLQLRDKTEAATGIRKYVLKHLLRCVACVA